MASFSHEPSRVGEPRQWTELLGREMWVSLAIMVIWIVVFAVALYGPDISSSSVDGSRASIPSAVAVVPFAFFASWVVARNGYRDR